jgi:hypothetical protein
MYKPPDGILEDEEAMDITRLAEAARALVGRLDQIERDPRYQAVWHAYLVHGGRYTGPTYTAELAALREALG